MLVVTRRYSVLFRVTFSLLFCEKSELILII